MRKSILMVWCALFIAATFSGPVLAEESEFKISDYIPEKFKDFEWQIGGSAGLSGNDVDNEQYEPWGDLLYRHSHNEGNDWRTRFNSNLSYDYETVPQFLNFDMRFITDMSSTESESSVNSDVSTYPGTGETSYTKKDSWNYQLDLAPSVDAGRYLVEDFFVSGTISGRFYYSESPDSESRSRTDERYFYDPYFAVNMRDITSKNSGDTRRLDFAVSLMPGWGRLYEGVYASTAMYIIEELRKNGVLLREPDNDEMLKLCDLVYQNRLRHAIDDRLRRIETFDEILGYLADAGITGAAGHKEYLYFQDVWDYFPQDRRQFGWRGRIGLGFDHSYLRRRSSMDSHQDRLNIEYDPNFPDVVDTLYFLDEDRFVYQSSEGESNNLYAQARFEYGYPLSRQWQLSVDGTARFSLNCHQTDRRDRISSTKSDDYSSVSVSTLEQRLDTDNSYEVALASTLSYIYSSRTRLDFDVLYDYVRVKSELTRYYDDGDPISNWTLDEGDLDVTIRTTLTYRVSIPTTLTISAGYNYDSPAEFSQPYVDGFVSASASGDDTDNSHRYSVSVSLSHYLY